MEPSTEQNNHLQIKEHKIHIRFTLTYLLTYYVLYMDILEYTESTSSRYQARIPKSLLGGRGHWANTESPTSSCT